MGFKGKRIAMISTHGYVSPSPPLGAKDTGGQIVYVLEISKSLAALGYEVDIWTRQFDDQPNCEQVTNQVRVIRAPCGGKEFIRKEELHRNISEWCHIVQRKIQKDALEYKCINSHYWDAGLAGMLLSENLSIPHIHTPHSLGAWKKDNMQKNPKESEEQLEKVFNFEKRIDAEKKIYRSSDYVVATTPIQIDQLKKRYDVKGEHIAMIPPGYDDTKYFQIGEMSRKNIRKQLGFNKPFILCLGRMALNKGYDLLLHAFKHVSDRLPKVRLKLAIGGENMTKSEKEDFEDLRALCQHLEISSKVDLVGYIPDDELAEWYHAATVFALPSRYEPFGMAAIEAMACGVATVTTTRGGLWKTITYGRDALFADSLDEMEYGITLYKALKYTHLRNRLERMGAQKARSLFTWTGIANQLLNLIDACYFPSYSPKISDWEDYDSTQWE